MPLSFPAFAQYCRQGLRGFSTIVKPESPLPIEQFKIVHRVTALHEAGKNAVYVTEHTPSSKTYFLKDISDSEKYHEPFRKASEEGRPTDGIYPDTKEQKYLVQKEVFATRLMHLFLGDHHAPRSIYPVVRNVEHQTSYLVASQSVGKFISLIDNQFYVKDGKTMIKIDGQEYITSGRLAIKIAQNVLGERDGNPQNIGVVKNGTTHLNVVTIDHEHAFERVIDSYDRELQNLLSANIFTPFGQKMDLHLEPIEMRDRVRLQTIVRIAHLLEDGQDIKRIFQTTFSVDHPPAFKNKISNIVTHLERMRDIYVYAAKELAIPKAVHRIKIT